MTQITLNFLGKFEVNIDAAAVTDFHSDKARALLAYLALEPQQHSRRALAGLFWPEIGDKHALTNLRNTFHRLRQTLDSSLPGVSGRLFTATRQTLQCNTVHAVVDVHRFRSWLDQMHTQAGRQQPLSPASVARWVEALSLYQGELLAGFSLLDAPAFSEWLFLQRELLHQQALLAFSTAATALASAQVYEQAYEVAIRLLSLDLYREDSHRQLMRLLAQMGQPNQALRQFDQMRNLFQTELGAGVAEETLALVRRIAAGEFAEVAEGQGDTVISPPHPVALSSPPDLSEVPDPNPFFGRAAERKQIARWLLHDHCRVVAVLGMGGVGKTSLAALCVRELVEDAGRRTFDLILWRSLLNAPPLAELLPPLLQTLSDQQLTEAPEGIDEQLRLLLSYLRDQRVLLVLDNLESLLDEVDAGAFRPSYESYGQLIQQFATHEHQSHLLFTSRERPRGYARLERDSSLVRSLPLNGLDDEAGRQLLAQRGVQGKDHEGTLLIERYSGNPLVLKLVAETVDELFGGDISQFLTEEPLVFDDIRAVLDQQFARLSSLEQELLFWLAVERDVTPIATLRKNLLSPPAQRSFVEALNSLMRRSLVERDDAGFAMQNVVIEYLTDRLVETARWEIESGQFQVLHHHALMKAQSKTYIRESQARLILAPISEQLIGALGRTGLQKRIAHCLAELRKDESYAAGYAAGNLLNLSLHLNLDLVDSDFSYLNIRQAHLQGALLPQADFSHASFADCTFTSNFGRVKAIAISPDSRLLALGTDDGEVRLWRLVDGQLTRMLRGHQSLVASVAFSPDSRYLVSSSSLDGTLYLWDVESGEVLTTLHGHQRGVEVVTFSPDGGMVASGGHDGTIRLWDVWSGRELAVLEKHTDWVTGLAFHPNEELLVSCGLDQNRCYLWRLQSRGNGEEEEIDVHGSFLGSLAGHEAPILSVAFSPDGSLLATGGRDCSVRLWDVMQRAPLRILRSHREQVRSVVFGGPPGAGSTFIASSGDDFIVHLWDLASGQLLNALYKHSHQIWAIAITADGKTLASGGSDGMVHLWDLHDRRRVQVVRTLNGYVQPIYALAVSPNGDLFATGESDGRVRLWQLAPDVHEVGRPQSEDPPRAASEWRQEKMRPLRMLTGHAGVVDSLAFSPDGRWLVSGAHDKSARLWDVVTDQCIGIFQAPARAGICVAFHPNGKVIACGVSASIHLWEISASGASRTLAILEGHTQDIRRLTFSPDGRYLASCSIDETVRLWDVGNFQHPNVCIHLFDQDVRSFWSIVFSPNGELLAGGGRNGIHIWDLRTALRTRITYSAMSDVTNIRPVVFSPDGKRLVSGGIDRMIRIWDLEKDVESHSLVGHASDVTSTFFLSGGDKIISSSYDGTVRLWDVGSSAGAGVCRQTLRIPGPYEEMNITGVTGISQAQRAALKTLGAVEDG